MTTHKKLPPYGRTLRAERDLGRHPERVWVIYGDDWGRLANTGYTLCVRPGDYQPGCYDWAVCAGLPTHVVVRDWHMDIQLSGFRMACDAAAATAPVIVHWLNDDDAWLPGPAQEDISNLAYANKWPWWTARDDTLYQQRREAYLKALTIRGLRLFQQIENSP